MNEIPTEKLLDVREIPCSVKHPLILERWETLPVGDYFVLVNGHDPKPLRYQIEAEYGQENLGWEYLLQAQEAVAVKVTKKAPATRTQQRSPAEFGCSQH